MATQFNPTPQVKTRTAVLVFIKGSAAPIVLYVENPQATYDELQQLLKSPSAGVIEKTANGPIKKVSFQASQIAAVAMQDEQFV